MVHADESYPYLAELRALLLKAYGPAEVLRTLAALPGVRQAFVFGSWAARYHGEWDSAPRDLDVLLVGNPDPRQVDEFAARAEDELGQPVQATVVAPDTWDVGGNGFVRTVKSRPLVELELGT